MTADDTDESTSRDDEERRSSDAAGRSGGSTALGAEGSEHDDSDERVKQRGRYDEDTPGVTDARPGREDISESQMPSDYHEAVKQRPIEVNLPETPDLSEDAEKRDDTST